MSSQCLPTLCMALALAGCATSDKRSSSAPASTAPKPEATVAAVKPRPAEVPVIVTPAEAEGGLLAGERDEPTLRPEDFEQGFCLDDIYARYLIEQHRLAAPRVSATRKKSKRSRRHEVPGNFGAFSFARDRINGPMAPYFGAIPVVVNDRVDYWVQYFKASGRRQFMKWLVRGESMRQMVQPVLQDTGIPIEFFYLAMIESGFNNGAKSSARATGTWQFMRSTAQLYGLKINHWVDERRDPVKSTIAAANYLRDLYAELGDWHLAMAAYNAGPGKVRQAIRRSGTRDFWVLAQTPYLAKETKHYVPKVLAAIMLASDAKGHGFDVQPNPVDALPEAEVLVKRPVRLEEVAERLGISRQSLVAWNPELIRDITPPSRGGYALRLPPTLATRWPAVERELEPIEVTDVHMHVVKKGDTLSRLARTYKVAVRQILAVNPQLNAARLKPGRAIAIPVPGIVSRRPGAGTASQVL